MDWQVHSEVPMVVAASTGIIISLLVMAALPPSLSESPPSNDHDLCEQPYECGDLQLYYPFWGIGRPRQCGADENLQLSCVKENYEVYTYIEMGSKRFSVVGNDDPVEIYYSVQLVPLPVADGGADVCNGLFKFSLNEDVLRYNQRVHNITIFYDCSSSYPDNYTLGCDGSVVYYDGTEEEVLRRHQDLKKCVHRIQVPAEIVLFHGDGLDVTAEHVGKGVLVNYTSSQDCMRCLDSNGSCGSNQTHPFTCYCRDGSNALHCYKHSNRWTWQKEVLIGAIAAAVIAGLLSTCYFTYKSPRWREKYCFPTKSNQDIETFLKNHGVLTIKRYKFSDVKKMTKSFRVKLGQGGFGAVYKGELPNGSHVAVKMLNPSKGNNGKEFINEVASISRTSHVNVVTLLGFCFEGSKKVLIYEFISNGSLDKFIYRKEGVETTPFLSWQKLYQISIGIARGLEYLHRGCNTQILHFDIKPHNILLDDNFRPKISDFGLAKLCPGKESLISMSDARGTIGYIAPEVWNRHFGKVSHKSDVYSYGMMLLDIVGGKKNINVEGNETSEVYFPDWIYKRLEQEGTQLGNGDENGEVAREENEVIKKMTVVGLWCIQTIPNDRPTMSKVVEMLEGNTDSIEMPPRPALSSPVRSFVESSTLVN